MIFYYTCKIKKPYMTQRLTLSDPQTNQFLSLLTILQLVCYLLLGELPQSPCPCGSFHQNDFCPNDCRDCSFSSFSLCLSYRSSEKIALPLLLKVTPFPCFIFLYLFVYCLHLPECKISVASNMVQFSFMYPESKINLSKYLGNE